MQTELFNGDYISGHITLYCMAASLLLHVSSFNLQLMHESFGYIHFKKVIYDHNLSVMSLQKFFSFGAFMIANHCKLHILLTI